MFKLIDSKYPSVILEIAVSILAYNGFTLLNVTDDLYVEPCNVVVTFAIAVPKACTGECIIGYPCDTLLFVFSQPISIPRRPKS